MLHLFQSISKWTLIGSLALLLISLVYKDRLPDPDQYDIGRLTDPVQQSTFRTPFWLETDGQRYQVSPLHDYTLEGVVVSYHDADAFSDIWHHDKWKDFLNVRDLCVIWGDNVNSGVYQQMNFENDSWTCWAYWPDAQTGSQFRMHQLSNNHLLVDDEFLIETLMSAEPGDHIRINGQLVSYENPANGFRRGTSTRRDDTGNGACETIYVEDAEIVMKANRGWRRVYRISGWVMGFSLALFLLLFPMTSVRKPFNG